MNIPVYYAIDDSYDWHGYDCTTCNNCGAVIYHECAGDLGWQHQLGECRTFPEKVDVWIEPREIDLEKIPL